ncbi:hypothetical protein CCP2SC5_420003 [Azospirillaceae bacterium]
MILLCSLLLLLCIWQRSILCFKGSKGENLLCHIHYGMYKKGEKLRKILRLFYLYVFIFE